MSKVVGAILVSMVGVLGLIVILPAPKPAGGVAVAPPRRSPATTPTPPPPAQAVAPRAQPPVARATPTAAIPPPAPVLPPLPPVRTLPGSGIRCHEVSLAWAEGKPMKLVVYLPAGEPAAGRLPCVFEAPAGTNLLHGVDIGTAEQESAFLPFTEAGMITVIYSLDGPMPPGVPLDDSPAHVAAIKTTYPAFIQAEAGVKNGRAAIDYVLARVPQADPERISTWGHSSAGTLALLLAAEDPRVTRCVALAPCPDLAPRFAPMLSEPGMTKLLPGLAEYLAWGSPVTHVDKVAGAIFLAHARDDDNVPFAVTDTYATKAKAAGRELTFLALPSGGHYRPLIDASLPEALEWIRK